MGFTLMSETEDGLFYRMVPPPGYTREKTLVSSDVFNIYIFDAAGEKVARHFQKEAIYDRDAFITFTVSPAEAKEAALSASNQYDMDAEYDRLRARTTTMKQTLGVFRLPWILRKPTAGLVECGMYCFDVVEFYFIHPWAKYTLLFVVFPALAIFLYWTR